MNASDHAHVRRRRLGGTILFVIGAAVFGLCLWERHETSKWCETQIACIDIGAAVVLPLICLSLLTCAVGVYRVFVVSSRSRRQ